MHLCTVNTFHKVLAHWCTEKERNKETNSIRIDVMGHWCTEKETNKETNPVKINKANLQRPNHGKVKDCLLSLNGYQKEY